MNCNSNTAPLPNVSTGQGCNVGCVPKPINVVCRQIIIPSGQEILAVEGDMNSSYREFLIPLDTEQGFDLTDAMFIVLVRNANGEQYQVVIRDEDKSVVNNYMKLRWNLEPKDTSVAGNLNVAIKAVKDNFKWETYPATFKIYSSLGGISKIEPPVLLQEKIVYPSDKEQIILPDKGYGGLSQVIVKPVEEAVKGLTLDDVFNSITTSNSLVKRVIPKTSMDISGEEVENRALTSSEITSILDK
ncbi:MAG: hypothetical protein ACLTPN_02705 [Clostridia bacterium]